KESEERQNNLKALVTLGSFLNFTFESRSALKEFVQKGFQFSFLNKKVTLVKSKNLLNSLKIFNRMPLPVPLFFRQALIKNRLLSIIFFPLTFILNLTAQLNVWQFLYHIPNVSRESRKYILYLTIQSTFWGILSQFHHALMNEKMVSI